MFKPATFILLQITQAHPQTHEFLEITKLTLEGLFVPLQSLAQGFHLRFKLPSRLVGLPLREGMVERNAGGLVIAGIQQVHSHVESRSEA